MRISRNPAKAQSVLNKMIDSVKHSRALILEYCLMHAKNQFSAHEMNYWQQQISGTLLQYPPLIIDHLQSNVLPDNCTDADVHADAKCITAHSLILLLTEQRLPKATHSEMTQLYRAINKPGRIIYNNPGDNKSLIVIANRNVTQLASEVVKIQILLYLLENYLTIRAHLSQNTQLSIEYNMLTKLTPEWLQGQVDALQRVATCPMNFSALHSSTSDVFLEFEALFDDLDHELNSTLQEAKSLDKQLSACNKRKELDKSNIQAEHAPSTKKKKQTHFENRSNKPKDKTEHAKEYDYKFEASPLLSFRLRIEQHSKQGNIDNHRAEYVLRSQFRS